MHAAAISLADNQFVASSVQNNIQQKRRLLDFFKEINLACLPAPANFITFYAADLSHALVSHWQDQGIHMLSLDAYGLPEYIRCTVGNEPEVNTVLASFNANKLEEWRHQYAS